MLLLKDTKFWSFKEMRNNQFFNAILCEIFLV